MKPLTVAEHFVGLEVEKKLNVSLDQYFSNFEKMAL